VGWLVETAACGREIGARESIARRSRRGNWVWLVDTVAWVRGVGAREASHRGHRGHGGELGLGEWTARPACEKEAPGEASHRGHRGHRGELGLGEWTAGLRARSRRRGKHRTEVAEGELGLGRVVKGQRGVCGRR
jgi:hypothetical protein